MQYIPIKIRLRPNSHFGSGSRLQSGEPPSSWSQDPQTGAKTLLYHIEVDRGISWSGAQGMLADSGAQQVMLRESVMAAFRCGNFASAECDKHTRSGPQAG